MITWRGRSRGHLTDEELFEAAEGSGARADGAAVRESGPVANGELPKALAAHLGECGECVARLEALRRTLLLVREVAVPEPSPMFWEHLSARVHAAVAAEPALGGDGWWPSWPGVSRPLRFGLAAALAAAPFFVVQLRPQVVPPASVPLEVASSMAADASPPADDTPLVLLGDLAEGLDWDDAAAVGMTIGAGSADAAVADLSEDERYELGRLLTEALAESRPEGSRPKT